MNKSRQTRLAVLHASSNRQTGMGHVMRSLAVAEELHSLGWRLKFVGDLSDAAAALVNNSIADIEIIRLSPGFSDIELKNEISKIQPDLISVDSYLDTADSLGELGIPTGNFSDGQFGRRLASITIDPSWNAESDPSICVGTVDSLLGPKYAPIRQAVRSQIVVPFLENLPKKIFVVIGGTDPHGFTKEICINLARDNKDLQISAIASTEKHEDILAAAGTDASRIRLFGFTDHLPELITQSDLVVTAAGTSVLDFMCMGIPQAVVCVAENQLAGYQSYVSEDLVFGLGTPSIASLKSAILRLMSELESPERLVIRARRAQEKVDGFGAFRVAQSYDSLFRRWSI